MDSSSNAVLFSFRICNDGILDYLWLGSNGYLFEFCIATIDYHSGYHPSHVHNFPTQQGGLVKKSVPSYYLLFFKDQDYELLKL